MSSDGWIILGVVAVIVLAVANAIVNGNKPQSYAERKKAGRDGVASSGYDSLGDTSAHHTSHHDHSNP